MNKQIVIICVGSPMDAQILAQQIARGEFDITGLTSKQKPEFKSDQQLTTEIVDAALSQFIEKLNKAEKKTGRCSLFRRCEDYLQQDRSFAIQLKEMLGACTVNGINIEDLLDEYELSFLPGLL